MKEWQKQIGKEIVTNLKNAIKYDQAWQVSGVPKNFTTGKNYNGVNQFMLGFSGQYFAGKKQIEAKGEPMPPEKAQALEIATS